MSKRKTVVTGKGAVVATTEVIKVVKNQRVSNDSYIKTALAMFKIELPAQKVIDEACKKASKTKLLPADGNLTAYGHKAVTAEGTRALAGFIDGILQNTVNTQVVDINMIFEGLCSFITTTSRVQGKGAHEQTVATFNKVISHLRGFGISQPHFNKYLAKRLATKGYTPATATLLFNNYGDLAGLLRNSFIAAKTQYIKVHKTAQTAEKAV